jgi:hypothetical protein
MNQVKITMCDLTKSIPNAIDRMLKEENSEQGRHIFQDALPHLLLSYGAICSNQYTVSAEVSKMDRRRHAFWKMMTHHYCRRPEKFEEDAFVFWLGFLPSAIEMKRDLVDEAAHLLTHQPLADDEARNNWLREYGPHILPGYHEYKNVMSMNWMPTY